MIEIENLTELATAMEKYGIEFVMDEKRNSFLDTEDITLGRFRPVTNAAFPFVRYKVL
jgi:hypothetical protein